MQVIITSPERAIQAGTWAQKNIKHDWEMDLPEPFGNRYCFKFSNPIDASFFALKWQ